MVTMALNSHAAVERRRSEASRALRRDVVIGAMLTMPLLAQMVLMLASDAHGEVIPRWIQLALATPVQFYVGRRFYAGAAKALRGGAANMDVLVVLGTTAAWLFSAIVTIERLDEHVYFEASAAVVTLVLLGKWIEARAKAGASAALEGLAKLQPRTAHDSLRDDGAAD